MRVVADGYRWLSREISLRRELHNARRRLLTSADFTSDEKRLISKVSLRVHREDAMCDGNAFHYLSVGVSAMRCIEEAFRSAGKEFLEGSILDFPSGFGRVLRFLRARFPDAEITAAEIDQRALDFCSRTFSVTPYLSKSPFNDLRLPRRFDLIWCGSLFTHIDEHAASDLLQFFHDHLSDRGVCVFTTHGQRCVEWMQSKKVTYALTADAQRELIRGFQSRGYGYADYAGHTGYGISAVSHQRMLDLSGRYGRWKEAVFLEHAWDNHQDVYALAMQEQKIQHIREDKECSEGRG